MPKMPPYTGVYSTRDLTFDEVRAKVIASVKLLFDHDEMLMWRNLSEETVAHHLGRYIHQAFPDLNVDVEYNGVDESHPKTIYWFKDNGIHEVWPDVIVHWRGHQNNYLIIELKKSTNRNAESRDNDHQKLISFTSPSLPDGPAYKYKFGIFIDYLAGSHIYDNNNTLSARGIWYVDGKPISDEVLCTAPLKYGNN